MGIFSKIKKLAKSTGIVPMSLQEATKSAPNAMGCYKIYCDGLKYVGKAEDGIRKRFVQYYNGTTAHYPSAKAIYAYRDRITVTWVVLTYRGSTGALPSRLERAVRTRTPAYPYGSYIL